MVDLGNAAAQGDIQAVSHLLSKGIDVNAHSREGMTPLSIASFWGYANIAKVLLQHGADINAQNNGSGWSGLHCAAFQGHGPVILVLMQYQPDLTLKDSQGRTAADFASALDSIWSFFAAANCERTTKAKLLQMGIIYKVTNENSTLAVQSKATHFSRPGSAYVFRSPVGYADPKMELAAATGDVLAGLPEEPS